jgi:hypothetical protein
MGDRPLTPLLAAACLLAASVRGEVPRGDAPAGWRDLSILNANEANRVFSDAADANPADREARLGEAVSLLNVEPQTDDSIARASGLFESLRSGKEGDDAAVGAAYYLARIAQLHNPAPDRDAVVRDFRELIARHPLSPYAQLAAPKLAILLLYDDVPAPEWERRVREVEDLIPTLRTPAARRDTLLILAGALIRLRRDHARAYPLITQCLAENLFIRSSHLNSLLLQAAESARVLGRNREAAAYYRRFLEEFPSDMKSDEIRRRLGPLVRTPRQ